MRKYVYENAIVYVTEPTDEQVQNIHAATKRFVHKLAKEGLIDHVKRRNNYGASRTGPDARKRNR